MELDSKHRNTWINHPRNGFDKRQCSLPVIVRFCPEGQRPRLAIIFRGGGKRITDDEKLTYHLDVDIYLQKNAWMDTSVCMEWGEKTITESCSQEKLSRYVLLANLEAHTKDNFKKLVSSMNGVVWYRLTNVTNVWQPVDAGIEITYFN